MTPSTAVGSFAERCRLLTAGRGPVWLGVAPSSRWLTEWELPDTVPGARRYCEITLEAATGLLTGLKVQTPFFLRFGTAGLDLLAWYARAAGEAGLLVLADAKIGDADDTMRAHADLYLGPGSVVGADAVTAHAFLGLGSLGPLFTYAAGTGTGVLVLVRTSNHAATEVQGAPHAGGGTVAQALAEGLTRLIEAAGWERAGPVGALVGARPPESHDLVGRLPYGVLELPGLGRPGRTVAEVVGPALARTEPLLLPVTTGALRHGPGVARLRASLARWQEDVRTAFPPSQQNVDTGINDFRDDPVKRPA
ncbi:orotidine 5'-phosphate decarboxylase [Acrocarpospora phusangensis]|uniref:Orotidine-5'-phosphate decarboxylase n=1 Tax=Acrocarpospora phusangensis TaxID=1070424 RepID=A0A919QIQ6_9ACTN|nr:orotidine-5'-phosphate decarboxylase [Acrocarpospora phusangensis]GIH28764.1 orotidine 5'-phosphate decarboxylase [Acrocarpospora phusangensis]